MVGVFVAAFTLCGSAASAATEPIRIAMVEGLSGSFANAGEAAYRSLLIAVERVNARGGFDDGTMRAADHQFIQPLYVSVMERAGSPGVAHDNEGSGFGFRTVRHVEPRLTEQPTTCRMERPQ